MSAPSAHRVDLWSATIDSAGSQAAWPLLTDDERQHAATFRSSLARDQFVVGHGLLRSVLSSHLGVPPAAVSFKTEPDGKPHLAGTGGGGPLQFNLSHSGSVAVLAVATSRTVGVDVEELSRRVDIDGVARRQFTERECGLLADLDETQVASMFFTLWVRKEALIKALGTGFRVPTRTMDVGLDERVPAHGREWLIRSFAIAGGYAAAVAIEDGPQPVSIPPAATPWDIASGRGETTDGEGQIIRPT